MPVICFAGTAAGRGDQFRATMGVPRTPGANLLSRTAPLRGVPGLEEFVSALTRYRSLMLDEPDLERASSIEAEQLRVMEEVRDRVDDSAPLDEVLERLRAEGAMGKIVEEVAEGLGVRMEVSGDEAYRSVEEDGLEGAGAMPVLVALQAVARAYAERYQARKGRLRREGATCPLCGTESGTMVKEGDRYYMVCPLCGYEWLVSEGAPACPRCGERERLGVYTDRVGILGLGACQGCGNVWHLILGEVDAPQILLPLIAMGAERFRRALPDAGRPGSEDG